MEFLAEKDKSEGVTVGRGTWDEDERARSKLKVRAQAMLLEFEKRRAELSRTVSHQ